MTIGKVKKRRKAVKLRKPSIVAHVKLSSPVCSSKAVNPTPNMPGAEATIAKKKIYFKNF